MRRRGSNSDVVRKIQQPLSLYEVTSSALKVSLGFSCCLRAVKTLTVFVKQQLLGSLGRLFQK